MDAMHRRKSLGAKKTADTARAGKSRSVADGREETLRPRDTHPEFVDSQKRIKGNLKQIKINLKYSYMILSEDALVFMMLILYSKILPDSSLVVSLQHSIMVQIMNTQNLVIEKLPLTDLNFLILANTVYLSLEKPIMLILKILPLMLNKLLIIFLNTSKPISLSLNNC